MELHKLKNTEIQGYDASKVAETETSIRRELAMLRLDIYAEKGKNCGKKKSLRKNLARVLTHGNQLSSKVEGI